MFRKIKLSAKLKKITGPLCFLPDGLYALDHKYIEGSRILKDFLKKKYAYGTMLKVKN